MYLVYKQYDYLFPENGLVAYKHGAYHSTQVCHSLSFSDFKLFLAKSRHRNSTNMHFN